jgi:hypothetical protein
MSDVGGKAENICSRRVFRILTQSRRQPEFHFAAAKLVSALLKCPAESHTVAVE